MTKTTKTKPAKAKTGGSKPHSRPEKGRGSIKLADKVAKRLAAIDGVLAVTLGGSWGSGEADAHSDLDLGIYYRAEKKPHLEALRELAVTLDDRGKPDASTDFGDWGPWINGGAWLTVDGVRIDWLYRELGRVVQTITDCRAGRVTIDYQPGHPHGFHNHMYLAEVVKATVLADPAGVLGAMQKLGAQYPVGLRQAIVDRHLWEAGFALETAAKQPKRGDIAYVAGSLYRSAAALVQVLFAINEEYFLNEKGSVDMAGHLTIAPKGFSKTVEGVLAKPGTTPAQLAASLDTMRSLVDQVRGLTARA